jgi:transposase
MNLHLKEISRCVSPGAHAVVILDGAGYHGARDINPPENITLLPLPPYSPELNPVENIWQYLRQNKLSLTVWDGYDEIVQCCCDAWNWLMSLPNQVKSITTREWARPVTV